VCSKTQFNLTIEGDFVMRLFQQKSISIALVVLFVLSMAVPMVHAQDEMMSHTCDSTTIMLLFVAEYEYGYEAMMDVSTFEKGQYAPLFDAMMMMDEEMMEDDDMMDDGEEMMDEEMMEDDDMMMDDMMMLAPAMIADEDPACTELRTSVEDFLYAHFEMGMMMMDESEG